MSAAAHRVRLRENLDGQVEGYSDPRRGDVIEVPSAAAARRLIDQGLAQSDLTGPLGKPYAPSR